MGLATVDLLAMELSTVRFHTIDMPTVCLSFGLVSVVKLSGLYLTVSLVDQPALSLLGLLDLLSRSAMNLPTIDFDVNLVDLSAMKLSAIE